MARMTRTLSTSPTSDLNRPRIAGRVTHARDGNACSCRTARPPGRPHHAGGAQRRAQQPRSPPRPCWLAIPGRGRKELSVVTTWSSASSALDLLHPTGIRFRVAEVTSNFSPQDVGAVVHPVPVICSRCPLTISRSRQLYINRVSNPPS